MSRIFLSASFPDPARFPESVHSAQDIGLATSAVAEGVLRRDLHLIFGGHPSITPIVRSVLESITTGRATVYQSRFFADEFHHDVRRLGNHDRGELILVQSGKNKDESVAILRDEMFSETPLAAFFVGGMQGIEDEFNRLGQARHRCIRFLFTQPGGVAAQIAERLVADTQQQNRGLEPLAGTAAVAIHGRGYADLVDQSLDYLQLK